ncbi:MAG: hypothetical protein IKA41_06495, partial [Bacteroidaceae bacterium]|nr:hypothetical protein [Bacteroidaceae bacterium]
NFLLLLAKIQKIMIDTTTAATNKTRKNIHKRKNIREKANIFYKKGSKTSISSKVYFFLQIK